MRYTKRKVSKRLRSIRQSRRLRLRSLQGGQAAPLTVSYSNKKLTQNKSVSHLPLIVVQSIPAVQLQVDPNYTYSLLMHDPDAPSHNATRPWLHWLITNIQHSDLSTGTQLISYSPPNPPYGTHRYYFTLYKQLAGTISPQKPAVSDFNLREFITQNNLLKVAEIVMRVGAL